MPSLVLYDARYAARLLAGPLAVQDPPPTPCLAPYRRPQQLKNIVIHGILPLPSVYKYTPQSSDLSRR